MEYLTHWRMTIAAKRLKNQKESISSIAPAVGYKSESAFTQRLKGSGVVLPGSTISLSTRVSRHERTHRQPATKRLKRT